MKSKSVIEKLMVNAKEYISRKKGQGLVEYAMVIGVVALILVSLVGSIGKKVFEFISSAVEKFP